MRPVLPLKRASVFSFDSPAILSKLNISASFQFHFSDSFFENLAIQRVKSVHSLNIDLRFSLFDFLFKAMVIMVECAFESFDPTPTFYADHPFLYFIFDTTNTIPIFCGKSKLLKEWTKNQPLFGAITQNGWTQINLKLFLLYKNL